MARAQANKPKGNVIQVDFTGTDDRRGGRSAHVVPGDYLLEVASAEQVPVASGPNAGKPQVAWVFRIVAGAEGIGQVVYYYTSLDHTQKGGLWKLRNLLSDLAEGAEIPKSKANVDLDSKVGKRVGALLIDDDPFEKENPDGSTTTIEKSQISTTYPASRFVGAVAAQPAAAPAQASAPAQQNGAAAPTPVEVAAAIAQPAEEDTDIQPLAVVDL